MAGKNNLKWSLLGTAGRKKHLYGGKWEIFLVFISSLGIENHLWCSYSPTVAVPSPDEKNKESLLLLKLSLFPLTGHQRRAGAMDVRVRGSSDGGDLERYLGSEASRASGVLTKQLLTRHLWRDFAPGNREVLLLPYSGW